MDTLKFFGWLLLLPLALLLIILARPLIMLAMIPSAILYCFNSEFRNWIEKYA